jgi:hypothetical protein
MAWLGVAAVAFIALLVYAFDVPGRTKAFRDWHRLPASRRDEVWFSRTPLGGEHARYLTAVDLAWLEWACPSITRDNRMPWVERVHHGMFMAEPEPDEHWLDPVGRREQIAEARAQLSPVEQEIHALLDQGDTTSAMALVATLDDYEITFSGELIRYTPKPRHE